MSDKLITIRADFDYVQGHLRTGYKEIIVSKFNWDKMTDEEKKEYFENEGNIVIDSWSIEDKGELGEMYES